MSKATLLVIQGADQGTRFEVGQKGARIGRDVRNEIRISDTEVSRHHAIVIFDHDSFWLTDRSSANGTYVNGETVRSQKLSNGDQIQIGKSVLLFNLISEGLGSQLISEKIDLVGQSHPNDQSSIVSKISQSSPQALFKGSTASHEKTLKQSLVNLQALYRISEEVVRPSLSLDQLLTRILDLTIKVVGADRGCTLIIDQETQEIIPYVFSNRHGDKDTEKMPISRSIVDYVIKNGQGVLSSDARKDRRFAPGQSILKAGICEAICVPIQGRSELMGVVYVDTTIPPGRALLQGETAGKFNEELLRLMVAIGRQSAIAIENHRHQLALLKAERLAVMGETIAVLSHHIKNILQGIRGGSYLIDQGLNDNSYQLIEKGWRIVEKNQNKIYDLVMDMLTFSKERKPVLTSASLSQTITDICELMQSRIEECNISLKCQLDPDMPVTLYDTEGIHRAVLNILINAIDAVEGTENAMIQVETAHDKDTDLIYIVISDNGAGIEEDLLPLVFNVFESTKGFRGTGLGLAVSQKIIREHGGTIQIESKFGKGCRFIISWPRIDEGIASEKNLDIKDNHPED